LCFNLDWGQASTYGEVLGPTGTSQTEYGFTGEPTDGNGLVYLRARYYAPALGTFTGLDPLEGGMDSSGSLNRYTWVDGNVPNRADPSGMCFKDPLSTCLETDLPYWTIPFHYRRQDAARAAINLDINGIDSYLVLRPQIES